jgi:hypothetical protein
MKRTRLTDVSEKRTASFIGAKESATKAGGKMSKPSAQAHYMTHAGGGGELREPMAADLLPVRVLKKTNRIQVEGNSIALKRGVTHVLYSLT